MHYTFVPDNVRFKLQLSKALRMVHHPWTPSNIPEDQYGDRPQSRLVARPKPYPQNKRADTQSDQSLTSQPLHHVELCRAKNMQTGRRCNQSEEDVEGGERVDVVGRLVDTCGCIMQTSV